MNDDLRARAAEEGEPTESSAPLRPRRKGIYMLPNAVTLAALFSGFYGIVMAMNGRFDVACIGIGFAAVLDSLDGRVARMMNSMSTAQPRPSDLRSMPSSSLRRNMRMPWKRGIGPKNIR